jgi:uncharacterized membrane protein YgcG
MKPNIITALVLAAASVASYARAETTDATPAASPSTPPPAVSTAAGEVRTSNQIVYVPQLPSAQELTNAAYAQGVAIDKIADNGSQISVTYKLTNGQINSVTYQMLPAAQAGASQTVVIPTSPAPAVVYQPQPAPRVVYYYPESSYYPDYAYYPDRYWYSPISLSLGFGYGYYGGYRGHAGYYGHGGFRGGGYHGGGGGHHFHR